MSKVKRKAEPATIVADDPEDRKGRLKSIGGSASDHWSNVLVDQAIDTLWITSSEADAANKQMSAVVAALVGIEPKDELEGMLAAQLLAAHNAATECYRRAMIREQTFEGRREALAQANKLSRTFTTLLEGLNRHRGKGQQKVTVEHVHVHAGGQAIVGAVEHPGGGGPCGNQEQPHARAIEHASQPPLWSEDPQREPMPVTRDE